MSPSSLKERLNRIAMDGFTIIMILVIIALLTNVKFGGLLLIGLILWLLFGKK
ncbi:MAG: hypothetical protein H6677_01165 [Candidatus Obscuribacterales bacterium]|nr:hypothetical protein [Candidatus Obscuribacterales bacterium]